MKQEPTNLATGAPFNEETWKDFTERLKYHCRGEGVSDHYTRDPIFLVREKHTTYGYDEEYAQDMVLIVADEEYETARKYIESLDEDEVKLLEDAYEEMYGLSDFTSLPEWTLRSFITSVVDDSRLIGRRHGYRTVNSHFTREAAEAFIIRKKHDYPAGLEVFVECQMYCWEFNAIKDAIMDGRLVYKDPEPGKR